MNASVIAGLLILAFPALIIGAGFASGNVFINLNVNTDRQSAPETFWAVIGGWAMMAGVGLIIVVANWGR